VRLVRSPSAESQLRLAPIRATAAAVSPRMALR
jgi:hypothetical protein